ncbi:MAG: methyltransferase domain-containing protein [Candidatus Hydrogenedentales bacterium]
MSDNTRAVRAWPFCAFPSLRRRRIGQEMLDDQSLEYPRRIDALVGLKRINTFSLTSRSLWKIVRRIAQENPGQPLRVLDLASGGGDTAIGLSLRAVRAGIPLEVHGCDLNHDSVEYANSLAKKARGNASFFVRDVLDQGVPDGYDVIVCTLFLHHLTDADAQWLLESMAASARRLVIISDLNRSLAGYVVAWTACRILSCSEVVHRDGPLSAQAAFTMKEFATLADKAGLRGYSIRWAWPFRFLFTWRPRC